MYTISFRVLTSITRPSHIVPARLRSRPIPSLIASFHSRASVSPGWENSPWFQNEEFEKGRMQVIHSILHNQSNILFANVKQ